MNWDWEKLQEKRQRRSPGGGGGFQGPSGPDLSDLAEKLGRFKGFKFPAGKIIIAALVLLWLASGIFIVEPDEQGLILRFGAYSRMVEPGPHYHMPFPIESALTPKVTQIRRVEVGFRSLGSDRSFEQGQFRIVPEESMVLTGDENIVDIKFIVQYQIRDASLFLFNIADQAGTIKDVAEAAMREVVGDTKIDNVLTDGKLEVQDQTRELMQKILDNYQAGVRVVAVQLQSVQPPPEVVDAFKDVASAREDRVRYINQAEAYSNDILPKARGQAAQLVNEAEGYKESTILKSKGESARFLALLKEYKLAPAVTRERLYLEAMEGVYSNPDVRKLLLGGESADKVLPFLPLDSATNPGGSTPVRRMGGTN